MAFSGDSKLICMISVVVMLCMIGAATATVTCSDVFNATRPCLSYLANGTTPEPACCSNLVSLNSMAPTDADKMIVCNCVKRLFSLYRYSDSTFLPPTACGTTISYTIYPSTDCRF